MASAKSRRRKGFSAGYTVSGVILLFLASAGPVSATWGLRHRDVDQVPIIKDFLFETDTIPNDTPTSAPPAHRFTLRHTFRRGLHEFPDLHKRLDVNPAQVRIAATRREQETDEDGVGPYAGRSAPLTIQRMGERRVEDIMPMLAFAQQQGSPPSLPDSAWTLDSIAGPNVTDRETVLNLARMAADDYDENQESPKWIDVKAPFNLSSSFGWKKDSLRGHVFADDTNSTIVISIKGTSSAVFDGAGTTTNDKVNDNLFFSCCCGQGGHYLWLKVCSCMNSTYTCNENCLVKALRDKSRYYHAAIDLYSNITELYPDANVWVTGHSLGGAVSSLLGLTFGLPVVTFEAVPDALPAARLGLPSPPGQAAHLHQRRQNTGAYHFGHTADPVYMGTCNAATSACTLGFYAMESVCHTGHRCVWDTVGDKLWGVSITTHRIRSAISDVYEAYDHLPKCEQDTECVDCAAWKFFKGNESEGTAPPTTSTTTALTRTETCKTPGWWGCLDETTTSTSTSTTTLTTVTCSSWGWFGNCLDPITTTVTSATTIPATAGSPWPSVTSSTSTCHTPGFFWGCWDEPTSTISSATPHWTSSIPTATSATSSVCQTPGWFWGCYDATQEAPRHAITAPPARALEI